MTAIATPPAPGVPAPSVARELPSPSTGKAPPLTVIAEGTRVEGLVEVTGDLRVDGRVEGRLLAAGAACEISRAGTVAVDTARAVSIVVHGTLRATEVVARRVAVSATGVLQVEEDDGGFQDHPAGGCRMGSDPATSVVDGWGRAHDHENLFVVGAPTCVSMSCANATLTFCALALRSADAIGKG